MLKAAVTALDNSLQNPASQVRIALQAVGEYPAIRTNKISSLYVTASIGYDDQPDFINAVCMAEISLSVGGLLAELNRIGAASGRKRSFRDASCMLDLDIINFDSHSSNDPHLTLSRPRAREHRFVMLPLAEILPALRLGGRGTAAKLATELGNSGVRLLDEGAGQD